MPTLIYHGHACVEIHASKAKLIIDPFLTGNSLADVGPDDVSPDAILITHGHGDHIGDTAAIAKRTGALTVSTYELAMYMRGQGLDAHPMHIGGAHEFEWGRVKVTNAAHGGVIDSADLPYFTYPAGFLVTVDGKTIYHPGDTALIPDMALYGRLNDIDVAFLPIGDNFTMGPEDAVEAAKMLKPMVVVPMHYDTFDVIQQDVAAFAQAIETNTGARCIVLRPGDELKL